MKIIKWEVDNPDYVVQIIHGAREHIMRYNDFAMFLNQNNISVYGHDHPGHGINMLDKKVIFKSQDEVINNINEEYNYIKDKHPNKKIVLFGHSLGSVYARLSLFNNQYDKVILSGLPLPSDLELKIGINITKNLNPDKTNPLVHFSMFGMFELLNRLKLKPKGWLSYNKENEYNFHNDPLCGGIFTNITSYYFLNDIKKTKEYHKIPNIKHLLITGVDDPVTNFSKSVLTYQEILKKKNIDVSTIIYDNMKHEILNEDDKQKVYQDILKFIK